MQHANDNPKAGFQCLGFAEHVYCALSMYKPAIQCMVRQGKVRQALNYSKNRANLQPLDYAEILQSYPNEELALAIVEQHSLGKITFPLGVLVNCLMSCDLSDLGVALLYKLHQSGAESKYPFVRYVFSFFFGNSFLSSFVDDVQTFQ